MSNRIWEQLVNYCKTGESNLYKIKELVQNNPDYSFNWNLAFESACHGGDMEIIEWMITEKGVDNFQGGFIDACHMGNKKLVQWFMQKNIEYDYKDALWYAYIANRKEFLKWFVTTYPVDYSKLYPFVVDYLEHNNIESKRIIIESD